MQDEKQLETKALSWPVRAKEIVISNQETYELAANTLLDIAQLEKQIKDHHKPIKDSAYAAHKTAVAAEKRLLDPLDEAKRIIKNSISAWAVEQENIRREAQRKIDEANRAAEKAAEDARLDIAVDAEQAGAPKEVVESIIETPVHVSFTPLAKQTYQKVAGVTTRETWRAEVTDIISLCKAIGAGSISASAVSANMTYLNTVARLEKDNLNIPGVKAIKETGVTTRL